jgi:formate C-acetyltransferase
VERAQLITASYRETEAQPMIIRRAKALEKILGGMTVFIQPDEIIVGNQCTKSRAAPVFRNFPANGWKTNSIVWKSAPATCF